MSRAYRVTWRDRLARRLANAALRIASREYRAYVTVLIDLGRKILPGELEAFREKT